MKRKTLTHIFVMSAFMTFHLSADLLVGYNFTGDTLSATTEASGVSASALTANNLNIFQAASSGLGYASVPILQASPTSGDDTLVTAILNGNFFSFEVTPTSSVNLTSLTFNVAKGGSSTRGWAVRSSVDSFATTIDDNSNIQTVRPNWTPETVDLSGGSFDSLSSPVTFRIYVATDSDSRTVEFDDIELNGSVIPEPSSILMTLLGFGLVGLAIRRRK